MEMPGEPGAHRDVGLHRPLGVRLVKDLGGTERLFGATTSPLAVCDAPQLVVATQHDGSMSGFRPVLHLR